MHKWRHDFCCMLWTILEILDYNSDLHSVYWPSIGHLLNLTATPPSKAIVIQPRQITSCLHVMNFIQYLLKGNADLFNWHVATSKLVELVCFYFVPRKFWPACILYWQFNYVSIWMASSSALYAAMCCGVSTLLYHPLRWCTMPLSGFIMSHTFRDIYK